MTEIKNMLSQIGEFIFVEMGGVKKVTYDETKNSCVILTDDGKEYVLEIKPK